MRRKLAACLIVLAAAYAPDAVAQHATAYDVESGARAYESFCAACHGPDGNLIAGIDLGRGLFRRPLDDAEIVDIIIHGIPNTPMPPSPTMSRDQAERIVAYLRSLPQAYRDPAAAGDPERGRVLVMESGDCLECHRVAGRGSWLGPDLSAIGLERRATELERSLLEPNAEVEADNRFIEVIPRRGEPVTGRLLNHDTFTVQLIDADQRLRAFEKSELAAFDFIESPMPSYRDELDTQAVADIVSFLVSLRGETMP